MTTDELITEQDNLVARVVQYIATLVGSSLQPQLDAAKEEISKLTALAERTNTALSSVLPVVDTVDQPTE